jgi:hypothetical protein
LGCWRRVAAFRGIAEGQWKQCSDWGTRPRPRQLRPGTRKGLESQRISFTVSKHQRQSECIGFSQSVGESISQRVIVAERKSISQCIGFTFCIRLSIALGQPVTFIVTLSVGLSFCVCVSQCVTFGQSVAVGKCFGFCECQPVGVSVPFSKCLGQSVSFCFCKCECESERVVITQCIAIPISERQCFAICVRISFGIGKPFSKPESVSVAQCKSIGKRVGFCKCVT